MIKLMHLIHICIDSIQFLILFQERSSQKLKMINLGSVLFWIVSKSFVLLSQKFQEFGLLLFIAKFVHHSKSIFCNIFPGALGKSCGTPFENHWFTLYNILIFNNSGNYATYLFKLFKTLDKFNQFNTQISSYLYNKFQILSLFCLLILFDRKT